jgi:hypothetical protein
MFRVISLIGLHPTLSMQLWSINICILGNSSTNKVVDIILIQNGYHYESLITTGWQQQVSVTHFWECHSDSNQYTLVGNKPDNMTYAQSLEPYVWQQFTMTIKESIQTHLTLVHVFHAMSRRASLSGTYTIPVYITTGMVGYCLTQRPSELLSLRDPHKSHMRYYIIKLAHQGQATQSLIDSGRGYHLRSSEHENTQLIAIPIR